MIMIMPPGNAQPSTSSNGVLGEAAGGVHPGVWEDNHFLGWRRLVPENWRKTWENMEKMATWYRLVLWENMGPHPIFMIFKYIWWLLEGTSSSRFKWLWNEGTPWYTSFSGAPWWRWAICCIFKLPPWEPPKKSYKHISNHLNMFWKDGYRGPIFWGERICKVPGLGVLVMQLWNSSGHQSDLMGKYQELVRRYICYLLKSKTWARQFEPLIYVKSTLNLRL